MDILTKQINKAKKEYKKTFPVIHVYCEDPWYSCPKTPEGCADDSQGDECNCGAEKKSEMQLFFLEQSIRESVIAVVNSLKMKKRKLDFKKTRESNFGQPLVFIKDGYNQAVKDFNSKIDNICKRK